MICRWALVVLSLGFLASTVLGMGCAQNRVQRPICGVHLLRADASSLRLAHEAGFRCIVAVFSWQEIEPAPGDYRWEYPDAVARACQYYGLELVVRLDQAPSWAISSPEGIPYNLDAYARFVSRVVRRYNGELAGCIIWNEPNLAREWANRPPNSAQYVAMLRTAYDAVRKADPDCRIVSAGLAPTNENSHRAMDERRYLEGMYEAGARDLFDVLGAHPYGFGLPPDDPLGAHDGLNSTRVSDLWQIMVDHGDEEKEVWATEFGWTTLPTPSDLAQPPMSEEQQAAYLVGALGWAGTECPWMNRMAVWNLSAEPDLEADFEGFSILRRGESPKPAYRALAETLAPPRPIPESSPREPCTILARDVIVRLGDRDIAHPHWVNLYGGYYPSLAWRGDFYLRDPQEGQWILSLEVMQVDEQGNTVTINSIPVEPPVIPPDPSGDPSSTWRQVRFKVPNQALRQGRNVLEIEASRRLPHYQPGPRWEGFQFRNAFLYREGESRGIR